MIEKHPLGRRISRLLAVGGFLACAAFLAWTPVSFAALAVDSTMPSQTGQQTTGSSLTYSFTNTGGDVIFVCATAGSNTKKITSVTYGGTSMTFIASSTTDTSGSNAETSLWYLTNPSTGANNVVVTQSGASQDIISGAMSFSGAALTGTIAQYATNKGRGTTASVGLSGTTSGNYIVDCAVAGDAIGTSMNTLNFKDNVNANSYGNNAAMSYKASTGGSVTMGYTGDNNDQWGIVAAELNVGANTVAIAATSSVAESATNATSLSQTFTVPSGSNRALVAHFSWAGCTPLPTNIALTWDSGGTNQAMTLIASSSDTSDPGLTELWGLVAPTTGTKTLKATWTNGCSTGSADMGVLSVTGANQAGGTATFAHAASGKGSNSTWSQAVTSASGDLAISGSGSVNTVPTPTNQTKWYVYQGANSENAGASYAPGASSVNFTYSGGGWSGEYETVGIDVVAAPVVGPSPTVNAFSASPATFISGAATTLSWNVSNASSVVITGNNLNFSTTTASGSTSVTPNATGTLTYTLSAGNANGTSTATTSVSVLSPGSIYLVQAASSTANYNSSAYSSASVTFNSSVTNGDMIAVVIQYTTNSEYYGYTTSADDLVSGCYDTNNPSSTYREAIDTGSGDYAQGLDIWYAQNVIGGSAPTVTCNFSSATKYISMAALEYAGVATSSALDTATFTNDSATSTAWAASTSTTATNGELVLGAFLDGNGGDGLLFTPGSGYTARVNQTSADMMVEDNVQVSSGTVNPTAVSSFALPHQVAAMAAFRSASAPLPAQIRWIQSTSNHMTNGVNANAQFKNPVTTGDAILVGMAYGDGVDGYIGCRDTYNATSSFHEALTQGSWSNWAAEDIWYATNVTGGPNDIVTCTTNDSIYTGGIMISEFANVSSTNPLDATSSYLQTGASSTVFTTGTTTTRYAGDLIFGVMSHLTDDNTAILGPGPGYTVRVTDSGTALEDAIQPSAGPVSATAINSTPDVNFSMLGAFIYTNAPAPPPSPVISSFSASPTSINNGSSTSLSWSVTNASSVAITASGYSGFSTSTLSGSTSVSPTYNTVYTLTATGAGGTTTATTYVTVAGSGITFIQATDTTAEFNSGSYSSVSATFANPVGAGDMIAVTAEYLADDSDADNFIGCRDNYNATSSYQRAVGAGNPGNDSASEIWYATNVTGGSNFTVTCSINPSVSYVALVLEEYAGVATSSALDTMSSVDTATASSTSWTTGTSTTRTAKELVLGSFLGNPSGTGFTYTAGAGFTKRVDLGQSTLLMVEDKIQSVAGAVAATANTAELADYNVNLMATFRAVDQPWPAQPRSVQTSQNVVWGGTSISTTFTNNVTAGDLIAVMTGWGGPGTQSVSASCGGTFTQVDQVSDPGNSTSTDWYGYVTASGPCTVTANNTNAPTSGNGEVLIATEVTGVATSSPLDAHNATAYYLDSPGENQDAFTSGSATTTQNGDYIWGGMEDTNANMWTTNAGTGYSMTAVPNAYYTASEEKVQSAAGPVAGTFTNWVYSYANADIFMMAFKPGAFLDTVAPGIPYGVDAVANSSTQITVSWRASTDNVGVTGYQVFRNGLQIATSSASSTSYADTGLSPSSYYSYTVTAFDGAGNTSAQSSFAGATTGPGSGSGIYFVQGADSITQDTANYGGYSNISAQFLNNVSTGNAIIVAVQYDTPSQDIVSSCSDPNNASTSYKEAAHTVNLAISQAVDVWYAANVNGGVKPTVTCSFSNYGTSHGWMSMSIQEYAGIASSSPVDATSTYDSENTTSSVWSTGSASTNYPGELVYGALTDVYNSSVTTSSIIVSTTSFSGGSGFAVRTNEGMATGLFTEDMVQNAAGPISATASSSQPWPQANVMVTFRPQVWSTIGTLDSQTYDTGVAAGAQLNYVEWKGTQPSGTHVEFQFAVGNTATGTWTSQFTGPDGTSNTYYNPNPGVPYPLNYSLYNNYRYFRYRVTLLATPTSTPYVNNVMVGWSP